jgi:hypothetical protein
MRKKWRLARIYFGLFLFFSSLAQGQGGSGPIGGGAMDLGSREAPPEEPLPPGSNPFVCLLKLESGVAKVDRRCRETQEEMACQRLDQQCKWVATQSLCLARIVLACQDKIRSVCTSVETVTGEFPPTATPENGKYRCDDKDPGNPLVSLPRRN